MYVSEPVDGVESFAVRERRHGRLLPLNGGVELLLLLLLLLDQVGVLTVFQSAGLGYLPVAHRAAVVWVL